LDAIVIKRNAIPLYGTIIQNALKVQIVANEVKDLYIALDPDAFVKSIKYVEYFMSLGINVYFVELPENSDPNSLGHDKMWELIDAAEPMTDSKLFEYKIKQKLSI
jgi:hypothetical protein